MGDQDGQLKNDLRMLRDRLKPRSLRARLSVFTSLLLGAISIFIFLYFPGAIEQEALRGIESKAQSIGAMAAHSVASAVIFQSEADMLDALRGALQNDEVTFVEVADQSGTVLASLRPPSPEGSSARSGLREEREIFSHSTPVMSAGAEIGTVTLELSLEGLRTQVARARRVVGVVSMGVFVIGILATLAISAHVTSPLRHVALVSEQIASGDLETRATASTHDEVGQMAASFNRMVDRLQAVHGALANSESRLAQVLDNIPAEVAMFDTEGRFVYVNPGAFPDPIERESVLSRNPVEAAEGNPMATESGHEVLEAIKRTIRGKRLVVSERKLEGGEGDGVHLVRFYSPILNEDGEVTRVIAYGLDITELREAEAQLKDTQERLLQAQKMESIGRLAGGVAHDFNNLLTTIRGNTELLMMDLDLDDGVMDGVAEIQKAADHAAGLTRQLLAFSRKQVTQPKILNLNTVVSGINKMLQRLIGEDIDLSLDLAGELWNAKADPGQLEQIIVNLAVNARDAMPKGGLLTVRTENTVVRRTDVRQADENVPAGDFVMIAVSDTGVGMDEETKERVFEPFFTLKGPGKGTGLGLATVYGIVKQAGGFILVYSEPGMGTTFKVLLPRAVEEAEAEQTPDQSTDLAGGTETILVVEDQEGVRSLTVEILKRCGYETIPAQGPEEAIRFVKDALTPPDLVLTDVVMPGMSGPDLVAALANDLPTTPVVFMSGYTDDQLQNHGVLDPDVILIEKPFSAGNLTSTVRMVLDNPTRYQRPARMGVHSRSA